MTRGLIILLLCLAPVCLPRFAAASTVPLPRTGQTTCWDSSGNVIACDGTGQDGEIKAGAAWPTPRFTDNGNGTVTDNLTGLIWLQDAGCFGMQSWAAALSSANNLASGSCGLNDGSAAGQWRLPNRKELKSLDNREYIYGLGWLSEQGFTGVSNSCYWSSSTVAFSPDMAWYVQAYQGDVGYYYPSSKSGSCGVWPVRGTAAGMVQLPRTGQTASYAAGDDGDKRAGAAWPTPRFTDNGNSTVTDNLTGLIWLKRANCFGVKDWAAALTSANNRANGACGLTDGTTAGQWRLPNADELESLVDLSRSYPPLPAGHPFTNDEWNRSYWTSSTRANFNMTDAARVVDMYSGSLINSVKSSQNYVWPVRGGCIADRDRDADVDGLDLYHLAASFDGGCLAGFAAAFGR